MSDPAIVIPPEPAVSEAIEETAASLESIQEAIDGESALSEERATELLREVRTCQTNLQTLLTSRTAENPQLQVILTQLEEMRNTLAEVRAELSRASQPPPEPVAAAVVVTPSADGDAQNQNQTGGTESGPTKNDGPQSKGKSPESNPSATPAQTPAKKKRHYVKI